MMDAAPAPPLPRASSGCSGAGRTSCLSREPHQSLATLVRPAESAERQAMIRTIQAQWALLDQLELDALLRALPVSEQRRLATALAVLCSAIQDPDDTLEL